MFRHIATGAALALVLAAPASAQSRAEPTAAEAQAFVAEAEKIAEAWMRKNMGDAYQPRPRSPSPPPAAGLYIIFTLYSVSAHRVHVSIPTVQPHRPHIPALVRARRDSKHNHLPRSSHANPKRASCSTR